MLNPNLNRKSLLFLFLATVISILHIAPFVFHGFLPQDDGYHAQIAQRILWGETPHVDFYDHYIGGLGFLNALGMKLFGESLSSVRLTQFLIFALSFPVIYWLALQFCSIEVAFSLTLLSAVWTLPNFPIPSANWYSLPLWLMGTAALINFFSSRKKKWLFFAGLLAGLGLLIKSTMLFFAIGATLSIFYYEQENCQRNSSAPKLNSFFLMKLGFALTIVSMVGTLVSRTGSFSEVIYFVIPIFMICAPLLVSEWRCSCGLTQRLPKLVGMCSLFWTGFLIPIINYVLFFASQGHLKELYNDVFTSTSRHLQFASRALPREAPWFLVAILIVVFIAMRFSKRIPDKTHLAYGICVAMVAILFASTYGTVYKAVWATLQAFVPATTLLLCGVLVKQDSVIDSGKRVKLFTIVAIMQFASLVQVPWAIPIYLLAMIPFLFLAMAAAFSSLFLSDKEMIPTIAVLIIWGVVWVNKGNFWLHGYHFQKSPFNTTLAIERAGLVVSSAQKRHYDLLIPFILKHAKDHPYILAFPDSPEVYFLSGKKNPTKLLFDFLDEPKTVAEIQNLIGLKSINLVILRLDPEFSVNYVSPKVMDYLSQRFPKKLQIGSYLTFLQ